jgi:Na+(H+)/acetate symporter ActP
MKAVDWTQVLLAAISMLGTAVSAFFSSRAVRHSKRAAVSADRAVEASLRPPAEILSSMPPGGES